MIQNSSTYRPSTANGAKYSETHLAQHRLVRAVAQTCRDQFKTSEDTPLETVLELLVEVETKLQAFLATIDLEGTNVFYNDLVIFPVNFLLVYMYYSLYLFKGPTPLGNKYLLKSAQILFVDLARTRSTSLFLAYFNLNYIHLVLMITNF